MEKNSLYKWPLVTGSLFILILLGFQLYMFIHPDYSVAKPLALLLINTLVFVVPFLVALGLTKIFRVIKEKRNKP